MQTLLPMIVKVGKKPSREEGTPWQQLQEDMAITNLSLILPVTEDQDPQEKALDLEAAMLTILLDLPRGRL